jgi:hypothetical protein
MKKLNHPYGRLAPTQLRHGQFTKGISGNPNGRPKGAKNRSTAELIEKLSASGLTPVEFMTAVYRDDAQPMDLRLEAAHRAAPYFHAKMSIALMLPVPLRATEQLLAIGSGGQDG